MSKRERLFIVACFGLGLLIGPFVLIAQQQFSGGQTVTVGNVSLAVTESGTWTVQPGNTANTTPWLATINQGGNSATVTASNALKVDGSAVTQPVSLASLPALAAGTAKVGITYPYTGCGTTQFESGSPVGFAAMPTSATAITATTTCVVSLVVVNTDSVSHTYYFSDDQATPIPVLGSSTNQLTILAGERNVFSWPNGAKFNSGIKAAASSANVSYYALGVQ